MNMCMWRVVMVVGKGGVCNVEGRKVPTPDKLNLGRVCIFIQ